eukprot:scaffold1982_cov93-Amphora_coffeaeformis.AAC.38
MANILRKEFVKKRLTNCRAIERAVLHTKKAGGTGRIIGRGVGRGSIVQGEIGYDAFSFGPIPKSAFGFLNKVSESYTIGHELCDDDDDDDDHQWVPNRKALGHEMRQWTGTSGRLTPGC